MPRLTTERYLQARAFLNDRARELELTIFEHDFQSAPAWPVLDALAAFQNEDGGFGHGLEPDSRAPDSGALATSVALRTLVEVGAPASHPMVHAVAGYLENSFERDSAVWRIVPLQAEEHPHAPWWTLDGLETRFNGYKLNPKAEIVAQLRNLAAPVDRGWLDAQVAALVAEVEKAADEPGGLEMHDLIGAVRLLEAQGLPRELRLPLQRNLAELATTGLAAAAEGYGLRALDLAPRPDSALADVLADSVVVELDRLIATQQADGAWWPQWDWGAEPDSDTDKAWRAAKVEWAGIITLRNLRILNAHGLVDRG